MGGVEGAEGGGVTGATECVLAQRPLFLRFARAARICSSPTLPAVSSAAHAAASPPPGCRANSLPELQRKGGVGHVGKTVRGGQHALQGTVRNVRRKLRRVVYTRQMRYVLG